MNLTLSLQNETRKHIIFANSGFKYLLDDSWEKEKNTN